MAIETTYREYLLAQYLQQQLEGGAIPSYSEIEQLLQSYAEETDFSTPQFSAEDFRIPGTLEGEPSSAELQNSMLDVLYGDLQVLLQELELLTTQSVQNYERWSTELTSVEGSLADLESRVGDLSLLAQDTEGYVNFVADRFKDLALVDQTLSSGIAVNPALHMTILKPSSETLQAIALDVDPATDISFRVAPRGGQGVLGSSASGSLINAFSDMDTVWQMQVQSSKQESVTGELFVKLGETATTLSRIEFTAHSSNTTAPLVVTPLYSMDGYNYSQLPGKNVTQRVTDVGIFTFQTIEAKYIKFILTKPSADYVTDSRYIYEFGARLIQFFDEAFAVTTNLDPRPRLISKPLSVLDANGDPVEFSKIALETCEVTDDGTTLNYFVAVGNDEDLEITSSTSWYAIDPTNRADKENPVVVDVGDLDEKEFGDDETVIPSYDPVGVTVSGLKNPAGSFHLVGLDGSGEFVDETKTATVNRYLPVNTNDRILNYQFKCPKHSSIADSESDYFLMDPASLVIFRNVGAQGLSSTDTASKTRGLQRGWGFADPYYYCVVDVENLDGLTLDVGDATIWIDDEPKRGKQAKLAEGIHRVKVHKSNWYAVEPNKDTLAELIAADPLYPYNHKLLVEGYAYGSSFDDTEDQVYTGVDLFAQSKMQKVKIFDFINSVASDDYTRFAIDYDLAGSYGNTYSNMVIVIKVDENFSDSVNEQFLIRFRAVDQKFRYIRLRADFETTDTELTPLLSGYKIKLG